MVTQIKWTSLPKCVSKFMLKMFYEIDPSDHPGIQRQIRLKITEILPKSG